MNHTHKLPHISVPEQAIEVYVLSRFKNSCEILANNINLTKEITTTEALKALLESRKVFVFFSLTAVKAFLIYQAKRGYYEAIAYLNEVTVRNNTEWTSEDVKFCDAKKKTSIEQETEIQTLTSFEELKKFILRNKRTYCSHLLELHLRYKRRS